MRYDSATREVVLAGVKWHEKYNCYTAEVANWLVLSFSWSDSRYKVVVAGKTLTARGKDPEDAAKIAASAARKLLWNALLELPKEEPSAQV